jgi:hypothetical protein
MLRSIRSTAFLGTLLLAGAAVAQTKAPAPAKAPASDDSLIESGKPGNPPTAIPVPAAAKADEAAAAAPVAVPAPPPTSEKDWGFKFKGYFRGPMRLGIDNSGTLTPGRLQFHAPPVVPDGNYTRWMFTGANPGPWAELFFQYGNQRVMMTTTVASYNITSGGWRELQDQLGIDRAFLTLKFPEALGNLGGMAWDVGVFSNFYGAMGKYDGGEYQTFIMGRTRIAGATGTADIEINDDFKLVVEAGAGAKMDQMYQMYGGNNIQGNTIGSNVPRYDYPSWQPYPGQNVQNGTNLVAHIHAGLVLNSIWTFTLHYINSFVQDARWNVATTGGTTVGGVNGTTTQPSYANAPGSGSIQVMGGDVRLAGGWVDAYAGYSFIKAHNSGVVSDSIEVLHSQGGWQLGQNYFQDLRTGGANPPVNTIDDGNGNIHTIAGQATFSLAGYMMRPRPFWGQGGGFQRHPVRYVQQDHEHNPQPRRCQLCPAFQAEVRWRSHLVVLAHGGLGVPRRRRESQHERQHPELLHSLAQVHLP